MGPKIVEQIKNLPGKPGVYLIKDAEGQLLYVGKAGNLKSRVSSHFRSKADHSPRISGMVKSAARIETVVTDTELEAFLLEDILIKKHKPKYNVSLKDDKRYPYLCLSISEKYPRLFIVRKPIDKKDLYFGPYVPAGAMRRTLDLLQRNFPLRKCRVMGKRDRPCLQHQMGQCMAPCFLDVPQEVYSEIVDEVRLFLEGKDTDLISRLRFRMEEASRQMEYEKAAMYRDQIAAVEKVVERQKITFSDRVDKDVVAFVRDEDMAHFQLFFLRGGRMLGNKSLFLDNLRDLSDEEVLLIFLRQLYHSDLLIPRQILIPLPVSDSTLKQMLRDRRGGAVDLIVPQKGEKARLLGMARENAEEARKQYMDKEAQIRATLSVAARDLGLSAPPESIEAFDISNIQGKEAVGSMVVFLKGQPAKKSYRHFKIREVHQPDDYAMMAEVTRRHFSRKIREEKPMPDLVVVDGGKGQLGTVWGVLKSLDLDNLPVIGLAKRDEEIFHPKDSAAHRLARHSKTLRLIQHIRDESHRFALSYHRKLRKKKTISSELENIPGVGPARRKLLLKSFGSVREIRKASLEDIASVKGLDKKTAHTIRDYFDLPVSLK
jgi:excinuclease ABC subunit C